MDKSDNLFPSHFFFRSYSSFPTRFPRRLLLFFVLVVFPGTWHLFMNRSGSVQNRFEKDYKRDTHIFRRMRPLVFLVLLSLVVVLGAVAYPYLASSNSVLGKDQASAFVLQDVQPLAAQGIQARVVSVRPDLNRTTPGEGAWAVDVLLTANAHSNCPSVDKRFYTLPPVAFRSETLLSSCTPSVSIDYREEALIASARDLPGLRSDAYGCAFLSDQLDSSDISVYCPTADVSALKAFADGLPAQIWLVQWSDGGATRFVALSPGGQRLKSG